MELLLNLAWLVLAFPAYSLWRGRRVTRRFSSLQCLLALGCVLIVLFPVVSATDDLHAMRAEMEESPVSKRSLRQANLDKAHLAISHTPTALCSSPAPFFTCDEALHLWSNPGLSLPTAAAITRLGRAPPYFFFA